MIKCLLTPGREPSVNQSEDTTTTELGQAMSFIAVIWRSMGDGLFTEDYMT
jgi:agmatine/peptidylarginine deiminase